MDTAALQAKATDIRKDILTMITEAGSGHPGGSLSCTDILTALYFGGVMDYNPADPHKPGRDRFILAKGHAAPALYATLAHAGFFPIDELHTCLLYTSLLPALLLGVAVGNIFAGIPMDAAGDYAGVPLIGLITPFTLLTGLLGLAMFLAAGSCWAALKAPLPSCLQARAARLRLPLQVIALALFAVVSVYALVLVGPEMDPNLGILRWLFAALVVVGLLASLVVGKTSGDDLKAFLAQSASMIALVALLACSMFPVLVNATADSVGPAITLANAASSELSLTWMTIILCIGLPLVLVYHVVIYRTFRGRVNPADLEEY